MERLNIEISDNQYLIRLQRSDFDLNSLYMLLKSLGAEIPNFKSQDFKFQEDDMVKTYRNDDNLGDRFDHLLDK